MYYTAQVYVNVVMSYNRKGLSSTHCDVHILHSKCHLNVRIQIAIAIGKKELKVVEKKRRKGKGEKTAERARGGNRGRKRMGEGDRRETQGE